MSDENEIRINFGRPVPLFPLGAVTLMPHAVLPLHIFEPRYRQMVSDALDASGQIAMAVFAGEAWREEYQGRPALRPAVCLGQIMEHEKLPDGRFNLRMHGVCRARILQELPAAETLLYRQAILEPVGIEGQDESTLTPFRERLLENLARGPLKDLSEAKGVSKYLKDERLPTTAVMELISCVLLRDSNFDTYANLHYDLLAEGDALRRSEMIERALGGLAVLIARARPQVKPPDAVKGCSWN